VPYTYLSFDAAVQILAGRLGDPSAIYWNQPGELLNCIIEAVRFEQLLTAGYKQKIAFTTTANNSFYDLTNGTAVPNSPFIYKSTDVEVANNMLAALLEPPLPATGPWIGTGQFTFGQLQNAMQHRLNRILSTTGCSVSATLIAGPSPPTDLALLPTGILDLRRADWAPLPAPSTPFAYALGRMDEWAEQAYVPGAAQNPGLPYGYSVFGTPPEAIRMIPPPLDVGNVGLLYVPAAPVVNLSAASPVVLGIPDDLSAALKWGSLAELLITDGQSRDSARSTYCEQRYQEYIQLATMYPSVLLADVNNVSCGVGSVFDLDFYQPSWRQTSGQPGFVGMCGLNMACIGQTPDAAYGIGLICAVPMPVPPFEDYLQVSRSQIDPVLDYAQHIASFKMGGVEFTNTAGLFQNLITQATVANARLNAVAFYREQLQQPAHKSEMQVPRLEGL
jgi:hypothetical protein